MIFVFAAQYNRKNIAAVLRAAIKHHNGLKEAKIFLPVGVLEEISKISQNL